MQGEHLGVTEEGVENQKEQARIIQENSKIMQQMAEQQATMMAGMMPPPRMMQVQPVQPVEQQPPIQVQPTQTSTRVDTVRQHRFVSAKV